jgi:hypothetical protein
MRCANWLLIVAALSISTGLLLGANEVLSAPSCISSAFRPGWEAAPVKMSSAGTVPRSSASIAMNSLGDIFATWFGEKPALNPADPPIWNGYVHLYRYWAQCGSTSITSVSTPSIAAGTSSIGMNVLPPATDNNGNAIVAWSDSRSDGNYVAATRFTKGAGWSAPVALAKKMNLGGDRGRLTSVASDAAGNATVAWSRNEGRCLAPETGTICTFQNASLSAARFSAVSGWLLPETFAVNTPINATSGVTMSKSGRTIATYLQGSLAVGQFSIGVRELAGNWQPPIYLTNTLRKISEPVSDNLSNTMVLVMYASGDVYSFRYTNNVGWGAPVYFGTFASNRSLPTIKMNNNGGALALYMDGVNLSSVYARRYSGGAWAAPIEIITGWNGGGVVPEFGLDDSGNAIVAWGGETVYEPIGKVRAMRYSCNYAFNLCGWGGVIELSIGADFSRQARVAMLPTGNAVVTWKQADSIYMRRFYK